MTHLESKPGSDRCVGGDNLHDPGTKDPLEDKHVAPGTQLSQRCEDLEVWKDVGDLPTELLSTFFLDSFFFRQFHKRLPCPKCDTENLPVGGGGRGGNQWQIRQYTMLLVRIDGMAVW